MKLGIGIDLGGTNIKAMAFDLELGDEIALASSSCWINSKRKPA
jgi:sugar (pentulose or hexulose) kinase